MGYWDCRFVVGLAIPRSGAESAPLCSPAAASALTAGGRRPSGQSGFQMHVAKSAESLLSDAKRLVGERGHSRMQRVLVGSDRAWHGHKSSVHTHALTLDAPRVACGAICLRLRPVVSDAAAVPRVREWLCWQSREYVDRGCFAFSDSFSCSYLDCLVGLIRLVDARPRKRTVASPKHLQASGRPRGGAAFTLLAAVMMCGRSRHDLESCRPDQSVGAAGCRTRRSERCQRRPQRPCLRREGRLLVFHRVPWSLHEDLVPPGAAGVGADAYAGAQ